MVKKLAVNQETCIGCNLCPVTAEDYFELVVKPMEKKARVIKQPSKDDDLIDIEDAKEICPTESITFD